ARKTDADEPQRAGPVAEAPVEQRARELPDPVAVVDRDGQGGRAAADREVGIAELRRHGSRGLSGRLQAARHLGGHAAELLVQLLSIREVACERVLDADRDALDSVLESARVDAAGPV